MMDDWSKQVCRKSIGIVVDIVVRREGAENPYPMREATHRESTKCEREKVALYWSPDRS